MTQPVVGKIDRRMRPQLPQQLIGAKQMAPLQDLLDQLYSKDVHGNLQVQAAHVLVIHLLSFFNPLVRSLRMMEDLSQTPTARGLLGEIQRIPKSTLSDAHARMEPQLLLGVLRQLMAMLPRGSKLDGKLESLRRQVLACDASYFQTISQVAWALQNRKSNHQPGARAGLYVQIDIATGVPCGDSDGAGGVGVELMDQVKSEAQLAAGHVVPGAIHVYDRGFVSFHLLKTILQSDADFVLRLTTQTRFIPTQTKVLSDDQIAAGVISDRVGYLQGCDKSNPPSQLLREVLIRNDADPTRPLRLLTSLMDLDAQLIAELYRKRWQIELFFRWLKTYAQYTRLISHSQSGAAWAFYVAVIGVTLLALHRGGKPSKYDLSMLAMVACGSATLGDIIPILQRRHRERDLARIRDAKRRQSHVKNSK